MKDSYETLASIIYNCELDLLKSEVRKSSDKLKELISDDFVEFTSSGKEYYYHKGNIFQAKDDNTELDWKINDFTIRMLSDNCILALYKVIKSDKEWSLRSSIWKWENQKWKIIFHQGTPMNK